MNDYIVLIRRRPSLDAAAELQHELCEAFRAYESAMVFLHGDGVDALCDAVSGWPATNSSVDWCVCKTSLGRRSVNDVPPAPFRVATLTTLYQAIDRARRVDSLGVGGALCCRRDRGVGNGNGSARVLLDIGFAPADRRQHRETLEMALGAAALELDASVLFHGEGLAHLAGDAARGWSQITDFGLLDIHVQGPVRRFHPQIAVQTVDRVQAAGLRAGAATTLIL